MARKKHKHEDHVNHEAWAIPYGDLVTLLLAFFVVMYAVSSLNEGKYRVMAASISAAFGSAPRTMAPVQMGKRQLRGSHYDVPSSVQSGQQDPMFSTGAIAQLQQNPLVDQPPEAEINMAGGEQLQNISDRLIKVLRPLVDSGQISMRRNPDSLEVEIQSDILFPSAVARLTPEAEATVTAISHVLREEHNLIRVEGHTDNMPIATREFPSNWELSAARAASVVRQMSVGGVAPRQMTVIGQGEFRPAADNGSIEGRNANRRVLMVIQSLPAPPVRNEAAALMADIAPNVHVNLPDLPMPPQIRPAAPGADPQHGL
ncbi:MAG: flagellar motor protein MotD [Pseudomonadota bacterium]|nr:flagellar motor protein MotD [Pseudomonadota bacterium]